jgi:hypothetical protein
MNTSNQWTNKPPSTTNQWTVKKHPMADYTLNEVEYADKTRPLLCNDSIIIPESKMENVDTIVKALIFSPQVENKNQLKWYMTNALIRAPNSESIVNGSIFDHSSYSSQCLLSQNFGRNHITFQINLYKKPEFINGKTPDQKFIKFQAQCSRESEDVKGLKDEEEKARMTNIEVWYDKFTTLIWKRLREKKESNPILKDFMNSLNVGLVDQSRKADSNPAQIDLCWSSAVEDSQQAEQANDQTKLPPRSIVVLDARVEKETKLNNAEIMNKWKPCCVEYIEFLQQSAIEKNAVGVAFVAPTEICVDMDEVLKDVSKVSCKLELCHLFLVDENPTPANKQNEEL